MGSKTHRFNGLEKKAVWTQETMVLPSSSQEEPEAEAVVFAAFLCVFFSLKKLFKNNITTFVP